MAYNNSIPLATDRLSVSQGDLFNNFMAIQTLIGVNHVNFNTTGSGKHNFLEMPVQSPVPTTGSAEVGIYCQQSTLTSQPEAVFARQSGSTAPASVQITEFTSAGWTVNGWSRLPSGILLKWGTGNTGGSNPFDFFFPAGGTIPVFTTIFIVLAEPYTVSGPPFDPNAFINVTNLGSFTDHFHGFTWNRMTGASITNVQMYYLAIGI